MSSRENQVIMNLKSREIMSSRKLNLAKSVIARFYHVKSVITRKSGHRKKEISRNHVITRFLDSLYNMLMPNDRSRSAACHREARTVFTCLARASRWYAADAAVTAASAACSLVQSCITF